MSAAVLQPILYLQPLPTSAVSTALSSSTTLSELKQIHAHIIRSNPHDTNDLLHLLLRSCSTAAPLSLSYAVSVFSTVRNSSPRLSNHLIRQLSRSSKPDTAFLVYDRIRKKGFGLDRFSFPPLLKAAARVSGLREGKEVHGLAAKLGFDSDPFVQTGLVGFYSACGRVMDARLVFDKMLHRDVVTWSVMIDGYCQSDLFEYVFDLFEEMKNSNVKPDAMVLSNVISACGRAGNLTYGQAIHSFIVEHGIAVNDRLQGALVTMYVTCSNMTMAEHLYQKMSHTNLYVSTAMICGYSKIGRTKDARLIFDKIKEKDLVCWSAMISGYADSDQPQEALNLFNELQISGVRPDQVTILSVISACANLGAQDTAKLIHKYIAENGFGSDLPSSNALIDMYAKCGNLEGAQTVFKKMQQKNVVSWTSMINAFAIHGDVNNAIMLFHKMKEENVKPNGVTFVGVLNACSHAGLVEEGKKLFASMINEFNIIPKHEHYGCMADLLGRANRLREALELIETMPLEPNVVIWGSLMSACRVYGDIELGLYSANRVLELDSHHDGALVVLSNIYAKERRWQDVGSIRQMMKHRGLFKEKGSSRIEVDNEIHEFLVADRTHKDTKEIYEKLDEVVFELKQFGYVPNTSAILVDLDEEEKKEVVLWHSEKLAVCYGLINGGTGSPIRIVKNLRVCEDCHTFLKMVSKVYERELIIRDRNRFHHYKDGSCSCKDYW